jgi:ABC-2 type transport system ATP-binding protein
MDDGRILALDAPATLVRGLDAPTHVTLPHGVLPADRAGRLAAVDSVSDDGVSLTIASREPAKLIGALAELGALDGVAVRSATLEDVFLQLTGRQYRA